MISTSGFVDISLRNNDEAYVDKSDDLIVGSCGHTIRFENDQINYLSRPSGRADFQLLFISSGMYHFVLNRIDTVVSEGQIVVYYPGDMQKYYSIDETPVDMFWVHFTGSHCKEILKSIGVEKTGIYSIGKSDKISLLFKWIIKELQLKRYNYIKVATGYFRQMLNLIDRALKYDSKGTSASSLAENAILYFYSHFSESISIDELARSNNVTPCWFRKCFKNRTGMSPQEFLNDIRLNHAQQLIATSDFKINDIAERCGYDNSFYFSRIFAKNTGCSPTEYRKKFSEDRTDS